MSKMNLAVIDYKMSNMFSLVNALDYLGSRCKITADKNDILQADGAILPGVGAFPEAMQHLVSLDLTEVVREFCSTGMSPVDK
jgi:imidazole glycerol-phosphate synthase subunit HisH